MTTSPVLSITDELLAELDALLSLNANGSLSTPLPYLSRVLLEKSAEHIRSLTERLEKAEKDAWRYRWLRRHVGVLSDGYSTIWLPSSRTQIDANDEAETGSAIDAAIALEGADHE